MKPYELDKDSPIYNILLEEIKKEGLTPADIQDKYPKFAEFMRENGILKIKPKF